MNENNTQSETPKSSNLVWVVLALVIVVGGFLFLSKQKGDKTVNTTQQTPEVGTQVQSDTDDITDESFMVVEGGMFYFKPNEIKVKKGETVKILFRNTEGEHDFVIDEFNVQSAKLDENETEEITFIANKTGEFEFYCSIGEHRKNGMFGKLIVED